MTTEPVQQQQQQDTAPPEKEEDEEGLKLHYDVVLIGTGLVHAILASALARAGRSVLHCDAADYYGELDAVWSLPYLESQRKQSGADHNSWLFHCDQDRDAPHQETTASSSTDNATKTVSLSPYGSLHDLKFHSMGPIESRPSLDAGMQVTVPLWGDAVVLGWKRQHDDNVMEKTQPDNLEGYYLVLELIACDLAGGIRPRFFTVDLDSLVTKEEKAAQEWLDHRARSFAIDVTPGLIWAQGPAVLGLLQSSVSEYVEFKSLEKLWWYDAGNSSKVASLQAVPCSKNDVFASSLLSPMEKRRLMTFLQLALDFSVAEAEVVEVAAQEAAAEGSALPAAWETLNERHLNQGRSLARPQNKSVSASGLETLQTCIRDNMDFEEYLKTHHKLSPKLTALVRYALALDFGTEQMTVGQGMQMLGQHLQSLGRFGSTAFLVPMFGSGELSQAFCRSAAVYGATYLLRRFASGIQLTSEGTVDGVFLKPYVEDDQTRTPENSSSSKLVRCSHVIVPQHTLLDAKPKSKLRVLRRVSVLRGKPVESVRHAILIPPKGLKQSQHPYTIHGLWFDESVNVTPFVREFGGCSMLHLTTVVDANKVDENVLKEAVDSVLQESSTKEIYQTSFSYPLFEQQETEGCQVGYHMTQRPQPNLTVDESFEQARSIFARICPGAEFLTLSKEIDNMVKERFGDRLEEDDEQVALSNAMNLILSNSSPAHPLFIWLGDEKAKGSTPQRLLMPVPRAKEPEPSHSDVESIVRRIEEHCSHAEHDSRVYFATCSESNQDSLDFVEVVRSVIRQLSDRHLQFHMFTNGVAESSALEDIGLAGLHVSLFAHDADAYSAETGLDEICFQKVCDFISEQAKRGITAEVGVLEKYAAAGRVFARTLGAAEVHTFGE